MIQIFRNKSIGSVIAVILLTLAVHSHFFFSPVQIQIDKTDGLLSIILSKYISPLNNSIFFIIYIGILLTEAVFLNLVLNNFKMFKNWGYTIAVSYVLLSALIPQWHALSAGFIANILGIWLFYLTGRLYNNASAKSLLFNIGILTAIIYLLYTPFIVLLIFSVFAVAILRPFNIKEWIIIVLGFITPFYLIFSYLFITDQLFYIKKFTSFLLIYPNIHIFILDKLLLAKIAFGLFLFFLGFINLSAIRNQMLIQARKYWSLMLIYLLLITAVPFLSAHSGIETFVICILPFSAFIANFFAVPQKHLWLINFIFLIFIGIIVHTNWMLIKI